MSGYRTAHRLMIPLLFVVWAIGFGLCLDDSLRRTAYSPIAIRPAPSSSEYPTVSSLKLSLGAHEAGLRVGDRLLALGESDLRGAGILAWTTAVTRYSGTERTLPISYARGEQRAEAYVAAPSYARFWPRLLASLAYAGCAAFLLLKLPRKRLVLTLVYMNLTAAALLACTFDGRPFEAVASAGFAMLGLAFAPALALRAFMLLPDGNREPPRWAWYGAWLFSLMALADLSLFWGVPFPRHVGLTGTAALAVIYTGILVIVLARAYNHSDLVGRRKLRWVLLGTYIPSVYIALALVVTTMRPDAVSLVTPSSGLLATIPISIIIAITRYNFLDIDRLWSSTASLTVVALLGLAAFLFGMPAAASAAAGHVGLHPTVMQLFFVLGLLGVLMLAHQRVKPRIDQILFAHQHELEQGATRLIGTLSDCEDPTELARVTGEGVNALFRPTGCVIYVRSGELFAPGFVRGPLQRGPFSATNPLVSVLEQHPGILALEGQTGDAEPNLGAFQRAALETLGVPLAIPVHRGGQLVAFLCLGAKESGDVYTATDLSLLALIADKVSSELLRFRQTNMLRAGRELQDRLRSYVPGVLAESIDRGEKLETGEAEVSVLFVDIRGYSRITEPLEPRQIFSVVNRYTEAVSELIKENGGTVVEFNGDGMMAVFGAPEPLESKESAAVAAGCGIVRRIPNVVAASERLSVGVGVATGPAFVGDVHAVDRLIWTALGNTTNLASRLQTLTRDLEASMVIDEATWKRCGADASAFSLLKKFPIRGRRALENLYVLGPPATA